MTCIAPQALCQALPFAPTGGGLAGTLSEVNIDHCILRVYFPGHQGQIKAWGLDFLLLFLLLFL